MSVADKDVLQRLWQDFISEIWKNKRGKFIEIKNRKMTAKSWEWGGRIGRG